VAPVAGISTATVPMSGAIRRTSGIL
jgi:hypothetical protein